MLISCPCGATNRVPSLPKTKIRCGKCKRTFTPLELAKCRPEDPPTRAAPDLRLHAQHDLDDNGDCRCTTPFDDDEGFDIEGGQE